MDESKFIFVVCQRGAEKACKAELEAEHPELRFAFSRPGFLTFKLSKKWPKNFVLRSTFARTAGWSMGRVSGEESERNLSEAVALIGNLEFDQLHVWQRDEAVPGADGFEPFETELAATVGKLLCGKFSAKKNLRINQIAKPDQTVLDVVIVEPNQWWIGWHIASSVPTRWVGGVPPIEREDELISRAYYKIAEAAMWSQFPIRRGDLVVELGSAPGGATEFLLEQGASVFAIDPADLDESIAEHPKVMHVKMRSKDVSKKILAGARWLVADLNVAPNYTLDTVEEYVTNKNLNFRGLILTLKLTQWELAGKLDECRKRVKSWGFDVAKTRQLAFNRQEVCLVALKDRIDVRIQKRKKVKAKSPALKTKSVNRVKKKVEG